MTWNYRMTVTVVDGEDQWCVRELYYDDDGTVTLWSSEPTAFVGETWHELADTLALAGGLFALPVYDIDSREWLDRPWNRDRVKK